MNVSARLRGREPFRTFGFAAYFTRPNCGLPGAVVHLATLMALDVERGLREERSSRIRTQSVMHIAPQADTICLGTIRPPNELVSRRWCQICVPYLGFPSLTCRRSDGERMWYRKLNFNFTFVISTSARLVGSNCPVAKQARLEIGTCR